MEDPNVEGANLFDPSTFETKTALNGRRGVIREAEFIRTNYGKSNIEESTVLRLQVVSADLEKPRVLFIATGSLWPSTNGKDKASSGPFVAGGRVDKNSNLALFLNNLKASGFNMADMGSKGADALRNGDFTWRAVEKKVSGADKAYDVPGEFHGYVEGAADGDGSMPAALLGGSNAAPAANSATVLADAQAAVVAALRANGNEIQKGQLGAKVQPLIASNPAKLDIFALLLKDDVLAAIPGVAYDKKTLKLDASAVGA